MQTRARASTHVRATDTSGCAALQERCTAIVSILAASAAATPLCAFGCNAAASAANQCQAANTATSKDVPAEAPVGVTQGVDPDSDTAAMAPAAAAAPAVGGGKCACGPNWTGDFCHVRHVIRNLRVLVTARERPALHAVTVQAQ
jgi:hypothetical protein